MDNFGIIFARGLPFIDRSINWKHLKKIKMKKLLFVAILGTLVACGDSSSTSTTTSDTSTVVTTDTATVVTDTTVKVTTDTIAPVADTTKK